MLKSIFSTLLLSYALTGVIANENIDYIEKTKFSKTYRNYENEYFEFNRFVEDFLENKKNSKIDTILFLEHNSYTNKNDSLHIQYMDLGESKYFMFYTNKQGKKSKEYPKGYFNNIIISDNSMVVNVGKYNKRIALSLTEKLFDETGLGKKYYSLVAVNYELSLIFDDLKKIRNDF